MDSKRRRAQEDLEERENVAKKAKQEQMQAEAQYKAELARLRAEGAKRREEWREQQPEEAPLPEPTELDCALKLKWRSEHHGKKLKLTEDDLYALLSKVARVDTVALSEKKKRSALVVFKGVEDAVSEGLLSRPVSISRLLKLTCSFCKIACRADEQSEPSGAGCVRFDPVGHRQGTSDCDSHEGDPPTRARGKKEAGRDGRHTPDHGHTRSLGIRQPTYRILL